MKLNQIRAHMQAGTSVHYMTDNYIVELLGNELTVRNINTHDMFFLTDSTGIMLNGREEWFYTNKNDVR